MKKIGYGLLIFVFLIMTGCGAKKNDLTLNETARKLSKTLQTMNSFKVSASIDIASESEKSTINIDGYVSNGVGKLNAEVKKAENKKYEVYTLISSDYNKILIYLKENGTDQWYKIEQESPINLKMDTTKLYNSLLPIFSNDIMTQKAADTNNYNYLINISSEEISKIIENILIEKEVVNNNDSLIDNEQFINSIKNIKNKIEIELGISRNEFYISKISIDIKDILNGYNNDNNYKKFKINFKLSDYNKDEQIIIPDEVKNTAKYLDNPSDYSANDVELKKFMNSGYDVVLACDYKNEQEVYLGFKNNLCVGSFMAINMNAETKNYARQIASEYVLKENENISVNGSIVRITSYEDVNDENIKYDEIKQMFINSGYVCK